MDFLKEMWAMFQRTTLYILVILFAVGSVNCGDEDDNENDDQNTPYTQDYPQPEFAVFFFDQGTNTIYRMIDINEDGEFNGTDEVLPFFDEAVPDYGIRNCLGIVGLNAYQLLATDNQDDDNIVLITDLNKNGDAREEGESRLFFDGALPNDLQLDAPFGFEKGPDNTYYLFESNVLFDIDSSSANDGNPEAVYRLHDANMDYYIEEDEIRMFHQIKVPYDYNSATAFEITISNDGTIYYWDIHDAGEGVSVKRISADGNTATTFLSALSLMELTSYYWLEASINEIEYNKYTDELIIYAVTSDYFDLYRVILAIKDIDGSGIIDDVDEVRVIYDSLTHPAQINTGNWGECGVLPGNKILLPTMTSAGPVFFQFEDVNGDGDYEDQSEFLNVYDFARSVENQQPSGSIISLDVWTK